ncbi:MAG: hypothetical protein B7Z80_12280 [Rhodospirillales bacterium 20-64-7]|nr:MAG: hypothetical protein B7Z80_12280 [Rhodospirillales bacterium 20-64-7]HQT76539.1 hypothetical protein [Rhodopila sp.]
MEGLVARRTLLQAGALTGGLAVAGIYPTRAAAAFDRPSPITGTMAAHIRLNAMTGGSVRIAELDGSEHARRDLAFMELPLAVLYSRGIPASGESPLRAACTQAQALAQRIAAADWQVPQSACALQGYRIVHVATGRSVRYTAWVDVV